MPLSICPLPVSIARCTAFSTIWRPRLYALRLSSVPAPIVALPRGFSRNTHIHKKESLKRPNTQQHYQWYPGSKYEEMDLLHTRGIEQILGYTFRANTDLLIVFPLRPGFPAHERQLTTKWRYVLATLGESAVHLAALDLNKMYRSM